MLEKLFFGGVAALFTAGIVTAYRANKETVRRRSSPIEWDPRFPKEDFEAVCSEVGRKLPRVYATSVDGLRVTLFVKSNTGLTTWKAAVDMNDYGRLSGKYWIESENKQSPIPAAFADAVEAEVRTRLG